MLTWKDVVSRPDLEATFWRGAKTERRENSSSAPYKALLWSANASSSSSLYSFLADATAGSGQRLGGPWSSASGVMGLWPSVGEQQVALIVFYSRIEAASRKCVKDAVMHFATLGSVWDKSIIIIVNTDFFFYSFQPPKNQY